MVQRGDALELAGQVLALALHVGVRGDERRAAARGQRRDQADAHQHQAGRDHPRQPGLRRDVAVADRRRRHDRPPQRVAEFIEGRVFAPLERPHDGRERDDHHRRDQRGVQHLVAVDEHVEHVQRPQPPQRRERPQHPQHPRQPQHLDHPQHRDPLEVQRHHPEQLVPVDAQPRPPRRRAPQLDDPVAHEQQHDRQIDRREQLKQRVLEVEIRQLDPDHRDQAHQRQPGHEHVPGDPSRGLRAVLLLVLPAHPGRTLPPHPRAAKVDHGAPGRGQYVGQVQAFGGQSVQPRMQAPPQVEIFFRSVFWT